MTGSSSEGEEQHSDNTSTKTISKQQSGSGGIGGNSGALSKLNKNKSHQVLLVANKEDEGNMENSLDITDRVAHADNNSVALYSRESRKRRVRVPDKPNHPLNLWSIMKNCIGKDLSKIPMPVNFNEPLSMLQR